MELNSLVSTITEAYNVSEVMNMIKHVFTSEEDDYIRLNYSSMTYKEMARNLNITESQLKHRIQRHLKIPPTKLRKHFVDSTYFSKWSPNMAYIVGLICADGCIYNGNRNSGKISITLHTKDRYLLEQIALEVKTDIGVVHDRSDCKCSEMVIYNKEMYNDLIKLGLSPNKSLTLSWINELPNDLLSHFIRGYFDGDGSITLSKQSKNSYKVVIQFLGTFDFLTNISNVFEKELGIASKIPEKTQTKISCLRYRTKQARDILDWMYKDVKEDSLYLKRKYNKYASHDKCSTTIES